MAQLRRFPARIRDLLAAKLGRCYRCMRSSAIGTPVSWIVGILLYFLWPDSILSMLALVVALAFTILLLSHLVAYMVRVAAALRAVKQYNVTHEPPVEFEWDRRYVVTLVLKAGLGALVASVFGRTIFGRTARADETAPITDPAPGDPTYPGPIAGPGDPRPIPVPGEPPTPGNPLIPVPCAAAGPPLRGLGFCVYYVHIHDAPFGCSDWAGGELKEGDHICLLCDPRCGCEQGAGLVCSYDVPGREGVRHRCTIELQPPGPRFEFRCGACPPRARVLPAVFTCRPRSP
ncbi:MAG: DUF3624 family protein [Chloroflexi bacterium]|nr:DUF3624 family protein [Chloroflexota bacterium]